MLSVCKMDAKYVPSGTIPELPPHLENFEDVGEESLVVKRGEVVQNAKSRLSEYVDAEVRRIKAKYEVCRRDLDKREKREISEFLESTCERVKQTGPTPPHKDQEPSSWFW